MLRYKIELDAPNLSEERIRELLFREFNPQSLSVERIARGTRTTTDFRIESLITGLLGDGQAWKGREIVSELSGDVDASLIQAALRRLERRGEVRRIRHGTYMLAGRDGRAAAQERTAAGDLARRAVLARLDEARTRPELEAMLRLPGDTVARALASLLESGEVIRFLPEDGASDPIYATPKARSFEPARPVFEPNAGLRLLTALEPGRFHRAADLAPVAIVGQDAVNKLVETLAADGLVASFRMGPSRYVALTEAGHAHPAWTASAPKAPTADLLGDMGPRRAAFLQILATLGSARTVDVTHALADDLFSGPGCSAVQAGQSLAGIGLIEPVGDAGSRQPSYRLTPVGAMVTAELDRRQSPPDPVALSLRIGARRLARRTTRTARG
jgi:hypothetical protein